jgi:hypothetical protein
VNAGLTVQDHAIITSFPKWNLLQMQLIQQISGKEAVVFYVVGCFLRKGSKIDRLSI